MTCLNSTTCECWFGPFLLLLFLFTQRLVLVSHILCVARAAEPPLERSSSGPVAVIKMCFSTLVTCHQINNQIDNRPGVFASTATWTLWRRPYPSFPVLTSSYHAYMSTHEGVCVVSFDLWPPVRDPVLPAVPGSLARVLHRGRGSWRWADGLQWVQSYIWVHVEVCSLINYFTKLKVLTLFDTPAAIGSFDFIRNNVMKAFTRPMIYNKLWIIWI